MFTYIIIDQSEQSFTLIKQNPGSVVNFNPVQKAITRVPLLCLAKWTTAPPMCSRQKHGLEEFQVSDNTPEPPPAGQGQGHMWSVRVSVVPTFTVMNMLYGRKLPSPFMFLFSLQQLSLQCNYSEVMGSNAKEQIINDEKE